MAFFSAAAVNFLSYQGYGDWVARQEQLIPQILDDYQLAIEDIISKGLVSAVFICDAGDQQPVVVKFSPATIVADQVATLKLLDGRVTPQLFDYQRRYDMMVMEYIERDPSLDQVSPEELARALALWETVAPQEMPSVRQENYIEIERLLRLRLPQPFLKALGLARQQLSLIPESNRLIHRDLHPDNIMRRVGGQLITLDPHGGRGSVSYDIAYIGCRTFEDQGIAAVKEQIDIISDLLNINPVEVYRWLLIRAAINAAFNRSYWSNYRRAGHYLDLFYWALGRINR